MSNDVRDTAFAFGALALASALWTPFDMAVGMLAFVGLLVWDRATWGRQLAVAAWMCSRQWPTWISDPWDVSGAAVFVLGGLFFGLGRNREMGTRAQRATELLLYALCALPTHQGPHVISSLSFALTAACAWIIQDVSKSEPTAMLRRCAWILAVRNPVLALAPVAHDAYLLHKSGRLHFRNKSKVDADHALLYPQSPSPSSAATAPFAAASALSQFSGSGTRRNAPFPNRIPLRYYGRIHTVGASVPHKSLEDPELNKYVPLTASDV